MTLTCTHGIRPLYHCRECFLERERKQHHEKVEDRKKYNKNHPTLCNKSAKKWAKKNPHKRKIARYTRDTLKIPLGKNCELCNSIENLERHHPDYDYPEIIVTVCRHCHKWIGK